MTTLSGANFFSAVRVGISISTVPLPGVGHHRCWKGLPRVPPASHTSKTLHGVPQSIVRTANVHPPHWVSQSTLAMHLHTHSSTYPPSGMHRHRGAPNFPVMHTIHSRLL